MEGTGEGKSAGNVSRYRPVDASTPSRLIPAVNRLAIADRSVVNERAQHGDRVVSTRERNQEREPPQEREEGAKGQERLC